MPVLPEKRETAKQVVAFLFDALNRNGQKRTWLAQQLGVTPQTVWHYEHGWHRAPKSFVERAAALLDVRIPETWTVAPDGRGKRTGGSNGGNSKPAKKTTRTGERISSAGAGDQRQHRGHGGDVVPDVRPRRKRSTTGHAQRGDSVLAGA